MLNNKHEIIDRFFSLSSFSHLLKDSHICSLFTQLFSHPSSRLTLVICMPQMTLFLDAWVTRHNWPSLPCNCTPNVSTTIVLN